MKRSDDATELLRDLLITQLARAGVPQLAIRKILGCDMGRVNRIARYVKRGAPDKKKARG